MKKTSDDASSRTEEFEEIIPGLPESLSFDILSRIPSATELCRFKCVSKTWLKSISNPYFITLHRSRSDENPPFYCFVPTPFDLDRHSPPWNSEFDVTLRIQTADVEGRHVNTSVKKSKSEEPYLFILTSHKQLVCIPTTNRIYICNPSTGDIVELPKGSSDLPSSSKMVGFGYVPSTMEYKVVRLIFTEYHDDPEYQKLGYEVMTIISSKCNNGGCNKWRRKEEPCPYGVYQNGSITVNGFVIWEVDDDFQDANEDEDNYNEYILTFNLETEKIGTIPPPKGCKNKVDQWWRGYGIAELKGELYFVDFGEGQLVMNMWILNDWNTFEWSKKYSVSFQNPKGWYARRPSRHYSTS